MFRRKMLFAVVGAGLALSVLAYATPSYAVLPYYDFRTGTWVRHPLFGPSVAVVPVAVALPVCAAPACSPCASPCATPCTTPCDPCNSCTSCSPCSTCTPVTACSPCTTTCASPVVNYVAETAYRVQYVQTPVTSYRPLSTCDACGNLRTVYSPVVSYVTQAQQVPFTTYRPVISTVCSPVVSACGSCSTCSTCPTSCPTSCSSCESCATGASCPSCATDPPAAPAPARLEPASGASLIPSVPMEPAPSLDRTPLPATSNRPIAPAPEPMGYRTESQPNKWPAPAPLLDLNNDSKLKVTAPPLLGNPNDKSAAIARPGQEIRLTSAQQPTQVTTSGWHAARD
jgi:hypothetical protein